MILLSIKIKAFYKYIRVIKRVTELVSLGKGVREDEVYLIKLAVAEAVANVIEHSYKGEKPEKIEYLISNHGDEWEFTIKDYGEKQIIEKIKSRNLDDYKEGGLGVHIIQNIMDKTEYCHFDKGTILTMKKKIGADNNENR